MSRPLLRLAAFEPFGGRRRNAALETARIVASRTGLELVELPVRFDRLGRCCAALLADRPRHLLLLGEARAARKLRVERVAVNLIDARIPDNAGRQPRNVPVVRGGPAAWFSTLDHALALEALGRDGESSLSAGAFACNAALYHALHRAQPGAAPVDQGRPVRGSTRVGFIHVPALSTVLTPDKAARALLRLVRAIA